MSVEGVGLLLLTLVLVAWVLGLIIASIQDIIVYITTGWGTPVFSVLILLTFIGLGLYTWGNIT